MSYIKVWSKFSGSKDPSKKFKIVVAPLDRVQELAEFMANYFVKEENNFRASGVPNSEEALKEYRDYMTQQLNNGAYHAVVCCVDNGNDEEIGDFVGASVTWRTTKDACVEKFQVKAKEYQKFMQLSAGMKTYYDITVKHKQDKYYIDRGIAVHPDYRGYGIAQEFLKVRRMECKEHGVPLTGAWMSAFGTQKAGRRDGWEIVCTIDRHEFITKFDAMHDPNTPPTIEFMIYKI
ncbi:uncharacterized protein LOC142975021 [Anticarsia gemmatalis]|uniref:uncharacterized protein LOC142975021 n=1 Tax=Anticarsia gemmatalis TaxID=129554 RepID=UPI003F766C8F